MPLEIIKPGTQFDFIGKWRICVTISLALILLGVVGIPLRGFRLGIDFAFPTQTLWLERRRAETAPVERISITPGKDNPEEVGLEQAAKAFEVAHGAAPTHRAPVVVDTIPRSKRRPQDKTAQDSDRS